MENSGIFDGLLIECVQCGRYDLAGREAISNSFEWPSDLRHALSCAARQSFAQGQPLRITGANAADLARPHLNARVSYNRDRLLQEIAKRARRPHMGAQFSPTTDFTLIDCHSKEEFEWYIEWLKQQNVVFQTGAGPNVVELTLSMDGWNRVQPLSGHGVPGQCFVAMWFSEQTRDAYESGIEPAIRNAGFTAIRIDRKEHNNEIPDEIIAEIRNSEFIVADFTGQRHGVYYEAGFAMGLGRKVIWCCRKDEISRLHFDTSHKNHIDWETPQDLRERLHARIRATVLQPSD
jgi:hypothetical protein